ncbi:MAG: ABC transporter substrate-binding protein [Deltaproteobacteria bacterium]|nr:ABC transporter substrate-binding protein [Deltaproteobacteria bacterium]MBW2065644.1 ABC transporter substrate-binding protein [Deltaproteobacteria bacterium]
MRKYITTAICCLLVFFAMGVNAQIKNPDTFILANYGNLRTLDPAVAYDVTSSQRLWNIYEPLIFFDGPHTDKFKPLLAVEVPSLENGGISADGRTYTFTIRKGVRFHEGGILTPEDVVYSFKRNMIADPDGGPMWMLLEALTGKGSTRDRDGNIIPGIFGVIDKSVEARGDKVIFHLPRPYPPFLGILAYSASVILDKEWAIEKGCWDGNIKNAAKYNKPAPGHEPLLKVTNGTNAYRMKSWEPNKEFVFERFDGYWGKKPRLRRAIVKYVKEWSTRKLMLQNGDADRVRVDNQYVPEVRAMKGLKLYEVPQLSVTAAFFCQKINPKGNPNIGSGKLDGNGIPPDFFSDINVRKAFLHAFDRETYKKDVFNDLVIMPTSPNIEGLAFHKDVPVYEYDLEKSKEYMKKAWGGKVWEKGFKMVITHNTGNEMREAAALMLAENIMSLNPRFRIEVRNVEWKDYLVKYRNFMYPLFIIGWGADYADPHNFMYTFMHSQGVYGRYMGYKNEEVDRLCDLGIQTIDPKKREKIYHRLQDLWYSEAIAIALYQQIVVRAYRDWVKGYVPNPMLTDANEMLMDIWKE